MEFLFYPNEEDAAVAAAAMDDDDNNHNDDGDNNSNQSNPYAPPTSMGYRCLDHYNGDNILFFGD